MSQPVPKPATYQDVIDAPENVVAELVHGVLYTHPRAAPAHASAASVLGMDIGGPFQRGRGGPGGWWIVDEPELHFDTNVQRGEHYVLLATHGGEERVRAVPFAAVELELAALWEAQGER